MANGNDHGFLEVIKEEGKGTDHGTEVPMASDGTQKRSSKYHLLYSTPGENGERKIGISRHKPLNFRQDKPKRGDFKRIQDFKSLHRFFTLGWSSLVSKTYTPTEMYV